jgi:CIC family chloride channel protein
MLAGAASGIAAIFRAPLTGAVLGLESPYKRDIAYEVLAHALVASAASYATYAFLRTGQPYFPVAFRYELDYSDLLLCVPLGVAAGLSAKGFNLTLDRIRRASLKLGSESFFRYLIGGCLLSAIAQGLLISIQNPASLHSGLAVTQNLLAQDPSLHYGAMVFVGKLLATAVCFGMGGVGGLFLPSATIGAAIGACAEAIYPSSQPGMLILVGIGAFTGASYNSLLFSAVFIAETTGNPALVVPSLIASSIAYLTTSGVSNSKFQRLERQSGDQGHTFG